MNYEVSALDNSHYSWGYNKATPRGATNASTGSNQNAPLQGKDALMADHQPTRCTTGNQRSAHAIDPQA